MTPRPTSLSPVTGEAGRETTVEEVDLADKAAAETPETGYLITT